MAKTELLNSEELASKNRVVILNPPLFSHDGRLSLGQAVSCTFVDVLARYHNLIGTDTIYASKSYNAQGKPADAKLPMNDDGLNEKSGKLIPVLEGLISKIEKQKNFLGFAENGIEFIDYSPEVRESSQKVFLSLWSKGMIKKDGRKLYLSINAIKEKYDIDRAIENINFYPTSLKQNFKQLFKDTQDVDLELTKERVFATPIPIHICRHCEATFPAIIQINNQGELDPRQIEENCTSCNNMTVNYNNEAISPLFDLTTQANFLTNKRGTGYTVMVSGKNVLARYPYQTFLVGLALNGKSPFDALIVHSLLGDVNGKRMSNMNDNVVFVEDIIKHNTKIHPDMIRYVLIKAISQNADISTYNFDLLDGGQKFIYKVGNLRKFFKENNCKFSDLKPDINVLKTFINYMSHYDLKSAFLWAESYLKDLSSKIKTENDNKIEHDLFIEQQIYTNALWALEPFLPTIVKKSKEDLGLIF